MCYACTWCVGPIVSAPRARSGADGARARNAQYGFHLIQHDGFSESRPRVGVALPDEVVCEMANQQFVAIAPTPAPSASSHALSVAR